MKDWLGQDYGPGDLVIYGTSSGHCIQQTLARVVAVIEMIYDEKPYKFVPIDKASQQAIDNNAERKTVVKVQPLRSSRWKSHYGSTHYEDSRTGKRIDPWHGNDHVETRGHYADAECRAGTYVPTVFKDYVKTVKDGVKPVTLQVTENIVKVPSSFEFQTEEASSKWTM